jgi:four helix bundle protein
MKIYVVALAMVKSVHGLSRRVQRHDPDLARQMRRASASVPLNMAEGWHAQAGHRTERLGTAMREARETSACLDVSAACGYLAAAEIAVDLDRLDHIVATLWRLTRARK